MAWRIEIFCCAIFVCNKSKAVLIHVISFLKYYFSIYKMERTEPINPERKVSLLLKIWLYPNATAFKITKCHDRRSSFFLIICAEIAILYCFFIHKADEKLMLWFFIFCFFHLLPEFLFNKKIDEMAIDYYAYYNRTSLYIFIGFLILGAVCACLFMNDQIGH